MREIIKQNPINLKFKEWVFYDSQCSMCIDLAHRSVNVLNKYGFGLTPIQTNWVQRKIQHLEDPLKEMLLETDDGSIIGGADALIYISSKVWWTYGLFLIAQMPGVKFVLRFIYQKIAKNRYCISGSCRLKY